ncbi:MAG: hypothetical protein ACOC7U_00650 [Spirochaetota bacterium]
MSYGDVKLRISVKVGVAYGTDTELVRDALIQAAEKIENIMKNPEPTVLFRDFGESSLDFELLTWIEDPARRFVTESDLRYTIARVFRHK